MKSETSQVAAQLRKQNWIKLIRDCQSRPREMKLLTWCEQNGVTKDKYYYWLRKLRQDCLDEFCNDDTCAEVMAATNTIVAVPSELMTYPNASASQKAVESVGESFLDISANGINIRVTDATSSALLMKVLEVAAHVK